MDINEKPEWPRAVNLETTSFVADVIEENKTENKTIEKKEEKMTAKTAKEPAMPRLSGEQKTVFKAFLKKYYTADVGAYTSRPDVMKDYNAFVEQVATQNNIEKKKLAVTNAIFGKCFLLLSKMTLKADVIARSGGFFNVSAKQAANLKGLE